MTFWVAGSTIAAAGLGYASSKNAADAQSAAAKRSTDLSREQFEKSVALQEPFRQAGILGQNRIMELLGLGGNQGAADYGKYGRDFGMSDFQADPGYGFRFKEGLKALEHSAAARPGGLLSGNTLKAISNYGQESASNEYQNAFNRYQVNRANQLNPLQSLAGQGQTAAGAIGQIGQNYAISAGESMQNAANARASGYIGGANAITGGLQNYLNYYQNQNLINSLNSRKVPS